MPATPLHLAVIGTGSFGRNHVRVYGELAAADQVHLAAADQVHLAALVDPTQIDSSSSRQSEAEPALSEANGRDTYGSHKGQPPRVFSSVSDLLAARAANQIKVDAASVCVPTQLHYEISRQLLAAGIDVLVEKPVTATVAEAAQLTALAAQNNRILQVGHLERFNPAITAVKPLLNSPMFFEAHRLSIFTPRALDVDVVLDLMIHDLDIVLDFVQSPVVEVRAVGLPILTPRVDIANVRVEFQSGAVANFTASRVSTERVRKLRFFQPHQYISIDYARQDVLIIDVPHAASPQQATPTVTNSHPSAGLALRKLEVTPGEPLRLEIESFLHSVRTRHQPQVPGAAGHAALTLATQIREAMTTHHQRANLDRFTL